ncbi:MAG: GIY-YIG nuclease family protein [Anaerolineales bacterium]|nr:GIY-YIG nuclease family protein [Anaerolineales bacterium]
MESNAISLPALAGVYALRLRLAQPKSLEVGRLGHVSLAAGEYVYLGSANGPGGLRARLGRHLRGEASRPHWHIDYLRPAATVSGFCYLVAAPGAARPAPLECLWSQALLDLPRSSAPLPGFGASDCRSACPAHLVALAGPLDPARMIQALAQAAGAPPGAITCVVLAHH